MRSHLRTHLTYANVMATLGVFIALGGTSYAAITVTGKNVKNGSLTGADIKNNSVTGTDVKSLTAGDFKGGSLPAGPRGATGPTGPVGPQGPAGGPGAARAYAVIEDGVLDTSRSKGIAGLSYGCYGNDCESTPVPAGGEVHWKYCFKLDFAPDNIQVTPATRGASSSYGTAQIPTGGVPARGSGVSTAGCPVGFRSADATAIGSDGTASSTGPVTGLYVAFN